MGNAPATCTCYNKLFTLILTPQMTSNFYHKQTGVHKNRRNRVLVMDATPKPGGQNLHSETKPDDYIRKNLKVFAIFVVFMVAFLVMSIKVLEYMWSRRDQAILRSNRTAPAQAAPAVLSPMPPSLATSRVDNVIATPPASRVEVSRENGDRVETIYRWGKVLEEAGEVDGALDRYQEALNIEPDNVLILSQIGRLNIQLARYSSAVRALETAYRLAPNNPDVMNDLGVAMTFNQQVSNAVPLFDRLMEKHPDYTPALFNKGYALVQLRDYDNARPLIETYLEKTPDDPMALGVLAVLDIAAKNYEDALARLDQAIALSTNWSMPYLDAAVICATIDQPERALDYLERALAFTSPAEIYHQYQSAPFRAIRLTEQGRALEKKIADRARELMK